ncbi:ester cyclase [Vibrio neptunius]|uniref:Ester cyclase n=2 Tax=Vibrio neptunius TaxID=170651 RepID=A0ABS3A4K5_9VIBR|nr:ester cyclase [Vibrio neptunius]MBN3517020.1 ester cyclase [Vibrio neptunius]MBN3551521.1 ester cyclase [Vibrio neptunius]MBN3579416.1 ester cyclase [Vibrio neptunius]MCH9873080.1 ester cyclase [Vibrio neptunius]
MDRIWNDKVTEAVTDVMTSNTVIESPLQLSVGSSSFCETLKVWQRAFPTLEYREDRVTTFDNSIVIEWSAKGTHLGEFLGVSATGKGLVYQGRSQLTFVNNKVSHYASVVDTKGLLNQLIDGYAPSSASIKSNKVSDELYSIIPQLLSPFLTRRQVECLSLSTLSLSVKEVASTLHIKDSSVQTHLKRAFELFNVSNKKMFMAYICENNTIELLIRMGLYLKQAA